MTKRKFKGHHVRAAQDAALEISTQQQQTIEQLRAQIHEIKQELDALKSEQVVAK